MVVMPGLSPVVGRTEKEAQEKQEYLQSLVHPVVALEILSTLVGGVDLSKYDIDQPLPELPAPPKSDGQSTRDEWVNLGRKENLTIRQLAMRATHGRGKSAVVGTPEQVADALLDYWDLGVSTFLIRGFDPLEDATDYGRALIPRTRELVAQRIAGQRRAA